MYQSIPVSIPLAIALGMIAGGLSMRIFIFQHDCGHGSFFKSQRANNFTGWFCSLITLVPYFYWRKQHALHHATNGNLDKRGYGDMTTYTVKEYVSLPLIKRILYRIYRNPFMFLIFGPLLLFLFNNRLVHDKKHTTPSERWNVHFTNLAILLVIGGIGWFIGYGEMVLIAGTMMWTATSAGIWLFYVQHQFDDAYWRRNPEWKYKDAALQGSTYFKLPRILQWFTGNIGYHHIHHLQVSIPNYNLQKVFESHPEFHDVHTITIRSSFKMMFLSLWDEEQRKLVSFREGLKRELSRSGAGLIGENG